MLEDRSSAWPDSQSHWAEIPTAAQSFHSQVLQKWNSPSSSSRSPLGSPTFGFDDNVGQIGIPSKRHALPSSQLFAKDHQEAEFEIHQSPPPINFGQSFHKPDYVVQYKEPEYYRSQGPTPPPSSSSPFPTSSFLSSRQQIEQKRPLRHITSYPSAFAPQVNDDGGRFSPTTTDNFSPDFDYPVMQ